jgi:hypothetical protein
MFIEVKLRHDFYLKLENSFTALYDNNRSEYIQIIVILVFIDRVISERI